MKATIKLYTTERETANGFPLYVNLVHGSKRTKKCIAHLHIKNWNFEKSEPLKAHPNFNILMPLVMDFKIKCFTINCGNYTFENAKSLLFGGAENNNSTVFYEAALIFCTDNSTGKLNQTILNSFNNVYPGIAILDITPKMVQNYMQVLLRTNSANGVHTYLRKLGTMYGRLNDAPNPFKGIRPKKQQTVQKNLTKTDILKLFNTRTITSKFDGRNTNETINYDRYYYMLMFYLGGIDMVDLAALRYDKHVIDDRVVFIRNKGGTNAIINNKIFPEAREILNKFDCKPYLVPIYKYKDYKSFLNKTNTRFSRNTKDLNLSRKPLSKSARYTFVNFAQQLLIDQRITMEIVGHLQGGTHGIYTDNFPLEVRDEAHKRIIDLPIVI